MYECILEKSRSNAGTLILLQTVMPNLSICKIVSRGSAVCALYNGSCFEDMQLLTPPFQQVTCDVL